MAKMALDDLSTLKMVLTQPTGKNEFSRNFETKNLVRYRKRPLYRGSTLKYSLDFIIFWINGK